MEHNIKTTALTAIRLILQPVVSVMLKCGITWKEFSELSKSVFVAVASDEFGIKGRKTNVSRVSILTGINRKEIKRLREINESEQQVISSKTTDATRVLRAWHNDADFLDADGIPKKLQIDGSKNSFAALHKIYGGDVSQQAMLKELIKTGSVISEKDNNRKILKVQRNYFLPLSMDTEMLLQFGLNLRDHAASLNVNVSNDGTVPRRFEGVASMQKVDKKHLKEFKEFIDCRGQDFLEEVDTWLAERCSTSAKTIRLGVGAYAIHED